MANSAAARKQEIPEVNVIKLKNVRLSFPSLFSNEMYKGDDTGKRSATLLIEKGSKQIKMIEDAIADAIAEGRWKGKAPQASKVITTFRDGDEETYDGYENMMALKASKKGVAAVIDAARDPIEKADADSLMYPGMYVNVNVDFNAGTDGYGNHRVWCNLRGVQRYRDGERFASAGKAVDVDDEFDAFDDEEDGLLD